MVGVYYAIVKSCPEVGDLLITDEDIHENPIGTMTCLQSWIYDLDINDPAACQRVALKVMLTVKTNGAAA
jgi:hypothetical protein